MEFFKVVNTIRDDIDLFEMANVRPSNTGLPMVIYISPRNGSKHGPRIKVSMHYGNKTSSDFFSITISDQPEVVGNIGEINNQDIQKVKDFIVRNQEPLLDLWYDRIDPFDAIRSFKK